MVRFPLKYCSPCGASSPQTQHQENSFLHLFSFKTTFMLAYSNLFAFIKVNSYLLTNSSIFEPSRINKYNIFFKSPRFLSIILFNTPNPFRQCFDFIAKKDVTWDVCFLLLFRCCCCFLFLLLRFYIPNMSKQQKFKFQISPRKKKRNDNTKAENGNKPLLIYVNDFAPILLLLFLFYFDFPKTNP